MKHYQQDQSRRDFLRACLLAGASLAMPRWVSGGLVNGAPVPLLAGPRAMNPSLAEASPLALDLTVYPRSVWSAFSPRIARIKPATVFTRLTVHHAGNSVNTHVCQEEVVFDLNGILEAHLRNNYGDIGYHFIIDYTGRIWEGRSLAYEGAHVSGMNEQNIGVMLLGNFEEQRPAPDQISALFLLADALRSKYDIARESIYGHCDLGQSVCPGKYLYAPFIAELRQL